MNDMCGIRNMLSPIQGSNLIYLQQPGVSPQAVAKTLTGYH
jgi:hypothetical protein